MWTEKGLVAVVVVVACINVTVTVTVTVAGAALLCSVGHAFVLFPLRRRRGPSQLHARTASEPHYTH